MFVTVGTVDLHSSRVIVVGRCRVSLSHDVSLGARRTSLTQIIVTEILAPVISLIDVHRALVAGALSVIG